VITLKDVTRLLGKQVTVDIPALQGEQLVLVGYVLRWLDGRVYHQILLQGRAKEEYTVRMDNVSEVKDDG